MTGLSVVFDEREHIAWMVFYKLHESRPKKRFLRARFMPAMRVDAFYRPRQKTIAYFFVRKLLVGECHLGF
jgi:hypothetical protein